MKPSSGTIGSIVNPSQTVSLAAVRKSAFPVTCAILLVFMTLIPLGSAIKCYQCQSKLDPVCGGNLPKNPPPEHPAHKYLVDCSTLTDASGPRTLCRKQEQDIEGKMNVIRSCGAIKADKDCYQASNPPTKSIVCQCFEDGCNSATGISSSTLLISLVFTVLLLFGVAN